MHLLLGLGGRDALQGAVVLGPASERGLNEVGAFLAHVRLDALGDTPEVALEILGAHSRLVQLALHHRCTRVRYSHDSCEKACHHTHPTLFRPCRNQHAPVVLSS